MSQTLQLELDVLLPDAHGEGDHCVAELTGALSSLGGVSDAHVVQRDGDTPARMCLHLQAGQVSLAALEARARSVGAEVSSRYGHALWQLGSINHAARAQSATATLRRISGVLDASVAIGGLARIEFDREVLGSSELRDAIEAGGYSVVSTPQSRVEPDPAHGDHDHQDHDHDHGDHDHDHSHGGTAELAIAVAGFVVYLVARMLDWFSDADALVSGLYYAVVAVAGVMVGRDVLATIRARRFDIDMLMFAAAIGAAAIGHWSDAALLLVLFSMGHSLEGWAMAKARSEIESLAELAPRTVQRRTPQGATEEIAVSDVVVGDVLVVLPNERIGADAIVIVGDTTVDESPVTGESVPVDKVAIDAGDDRTVIDAAWFDRLDRTHRVFAGTLNGPKAIDIRVARAASDSTLARVVKMVSEAQTQVSPTQVFTQRLVKVFVPAVLALVAGLLIVPLAAGAQFQPTFLRAMAVLVAASPCALAIATPSAVLAGIARSARGGVLVKGGGPLEALGRVSTIAFDKTGTLTQGRPRLVAVEPQPGVDEVELLSVAAAVERLSDHPLATAITQGALERIGTHDVETAEEVEAVVGKGVTALLHGERVVIGNQAIHGDTVVPESLLAAKARLESEGATTMIVRHGERFLGVVGVMDTARPEAVAAIAQLRDLGIERMVMLSGDQQSVADAVAQHVGLSEARGGLLPEDKVAAIREFVEADPRGIAMVGDGVNDAPALATANVGIAMGAAGSDVALETADVALMADRLDRLPFAISIARRSTSVIRQNLFFSLGVVAVLVPLTIAGVGIGPAVIAHEGSTLVVVANALALLAARDPNAR